MNLNKHEIDSLVETWAENLRKKRQNEKTLAHKKENQEPESSTYYNESENKTKLKGLHYRTLASKVFSKLEDTHLSKNRKFKLKRAKSDLSLFPRKGLSFDKTVYSGAIENPNYEIYGKERINERSKATSLLIDLDSSDYYLSSSDYEDIENWDQMLQPSPIPKGKRPVPLPPNIDEVKNKPPIPAPRTTLNLKNKEEKRHSVSETLYLNELQIPEEEEEDILENNDDNDNYGLENENKDKVLLKKAIALTDKDLGVHDFQDNVQVLETYIDENCEVHLISTEISKKKLHLPTLPDDEVLKTNNNSTMYETLYMEVLYPDHLYEEIQENQQLTIRELITTEKNYLNNLETALRDFKPQLINALPSEDIEIIFGNLDSLCNEVEVFYKLLVDCDYNCNKIGNVFINAENLQRLYLEYLKNKPSSNKLLLKYKEIIKNTDIEFRDLDSVLVAPLQRLAKYTILLKKIKKESKGNSDCSISLALDVIKSTMDQANEYITIDLIQNSPINLFEKAPLIIKDEFTILKPTKIEAVLFLFQDVLVITKPIKKFPEINYSFISYIDMDKLSFLSKKELIFSISDYEKNKTEKTNAHTFVLEAKTKDIKLKWLKKLEEKLWQQADEAKLKLVK